MAADKSQKLFGCKNIWSWHGCVLVWGTGAGRDALAGAWWGDRRPHKAIFRARLPLSSLDESLFLRRMHVPELNEQQQVVGDLEGAADQERQHLERRGEERPGNRR